MKTKRAQTPNRGADDERDALLSYLERTADRYDDNNFHCCAEALDKVTTWVKGRAKRTAAKPGGLGRKAKAR